MRRILKKIGLGALLLALIVVASSALVLGWYARASQPRIDGTLKLDGLTAPVDIVRDAHGIPHIYAAASADAYFALGFVHAQDRLWQMEMNRRIAAGRVAEILGPNALDADRFLRTLGVRRNAEQIYARLAPDARAALDAYARGVNAFIDGQQRPRPPEFILTGALPPEPWHPADSIAWQTMMAWDLSANWGQEVLRMRLAQRLTQEQINAFLPPYPGDVPLQTRDLPSLYRQLAALTDQMEKVVAAAPVGLREGMGSNNWVVSGAHTASGKPLLANDPHLGLSAPALWYFAHLSAPGMNVIGATLPGLPAVVLGRNDRIAWGFTNTASDVQDLYLERINPDNPNQYRTPDGWAEFATRQETLRVKGAPDEILTVRETRHGPVVSGALPVIGRAGLDVKTHAVSFAWSALRPDDLTVQAGIRVGLARNWQDFTSALKAFSSPQQNMVYADVDGKIGFIAPGRVPLRKAENDLMGLAPAPGWDARYDWDGFIPFEALPISVNPASGMRATANEKIVADDYPYYLTSEWALPYRAERIHSLLAARGKHDLESFIAMQADVVSLAARQLLPFMRKAQPQSERGRRALEMLRDWDGTMGAERAEPLIFNAWLRAATRDMFADVLGDALMRDYWDLRNVHQPLLNALADPAGKGQWCRKPERAAATPEQACLDLVSRALETALEEMEKRHGKDMASWRWGEAHQARSEHRPFGRVPPLDRLFDIRVASPGDAYTVNVGRFSMRDDKAPFVNRHAASLRAIYDLSDPERSLFMHSTGQSGNVFSPLYRNFVQPWAAVQYVPMQTRREQVERNRLGLLRLTP
ncbi:penicillin amidase [Noviherbaspirillum humi]|uniref:Penicillin amidase n=1 Tax=Noviherbaspirillum humi TaxID=1688639 RepID=A0A239H9N0_9BURK|nr:penicillin acylase family protein [Noviherbaspirillum humi]SNS78070.1 penicillin amidase [Noviherbaspirillum humi]